MFDTLPALTKEKAFDILFSPIEKLNLASDYYKAVTNLLRYPGEDTENILIYLLENKSQDQSIRIAKRKALDVLGRLGSKKSIPIIAKFLKDKDKYLVENASWALKQLDCQDFEVHKLLINLLEDTSQNRRVIIQTLADLFVIKSLPNIMKIVNNSSASNGEYGAAIAAVTILTKKKFRFNDLETLLLSSNQNDRQSAIQDIIDAGAVDLLIPIAKTPVSPFFRLRAIDKLCCFENDKYKEIGVLQMIDNLIKDDPNEINLFNFYDEEKDLDGLMDELFHTDFFRSYLALKNICHFKAFEIWEKLYIQIPRFEKDYGALYFLFQLFLLVPNWPEQAKPQIVQIAKDAINSSWPEFIKFRPVAILALIKYHYVESILYIEKYCDANKTTYWVSRYACLIGLDLYTPIDFKIKYLDKIEKMKLDCNRFVALKAEEIINSNLQ